MIGFPLTLIRCLSFNLSEPSLAIMPIHPFGGLDNFRESSLPVDIQPIDQYQSNYYHLLGKPSYFIALPGFLDKIANPLAVSIADSPPIPIITSTFCNKLLLFFWPDQLSCRLLWCDPKMNYLIILILDLNVPGALIHDT